MNVSKKTWLAEFEGKIHNISIMGWIELLKDKPITEHLTYNTIRTRLKNRKRSGHTIRQCLGVDKTREQPQKKNNTPIVSKTAMPAVLFANELLHKRLTTGGCMVNGYCPCGLEKG